MRVLCELTKRNVKLFLRDKASVFFSFLSVLIIIALYMVFLGDMQVQSIEEEMGHVEGIRWLINSWIMAGIIVVNTVSLPLGALNTIINDQEKNVTDDLFSSPVPRSKIMLSYIFSSWIIGILLSVITFIIGEGYIALQGGSLLPFFDIIKVLGIIILSVISSSSFLFFIITFIKSSNAFGVLSTIIGTFIGFLSGIYIPIGVLGSGMQSIIKLFPPAHTVTVLRQIFLDRPMTLVFKDAPLNVINEYKELNGINMTAFGHEVNFLSMVLYILGIAFIFYLLSAFRIKRMIKK
ncbi:MAG: ABC transporter permease [Bacilli bacterium]